MGHRRYVFVLFVGSTPLIPSSATCDIFISYRDPNCSKTADVYQACAEWAANARFTDEDVAQVQRPPCSPLVTRCALLVKPLQAKLSLFSSIDAPLPPSQRGLSLFTSGISDESRQQFRDGAYQTRFVADAAAVLAHAHCQAF